MCTSYHQKVFFLEVFGYIKATKKTTHLGGAGISYLLSYSRFLLAILGLGCKKGLQVV